MHRPKRLPRHLLAAALAMLSAQALLSAPALDGRAVTFRELGNGLRVVVKPEDATDLVAIGLYVRAGTITEQGWPDGISGVVQQALFDGPDEGKAAKVRRRLEILGGRLTSGVTPDFTHVHVAIAGSHLQEALQVLAELVGERAFAPTIVHELRETLQSRLRAERGDPRAIPLQMMRRLWDLAYETHPYAKALRGTPESIGQITHTRATEYYERFYAPGNISLLVVGAVTPGEAVAAAASTLGRIPRRDVRWQRPDPEPPQTDARKDTVLVPAPRHAFMMAFHGPGIDDKRDVCAMDVIYTILGQGERSRLLRVLRDEQKVVLSAEVEFITRRDPGLFIVTCIAAPDREQAAREGVLQQIQRLADEPLPPDELAQAKKLLRDAYAFSNETLADQTGSMGFYDSIDTYKFALDYIAEVNKVTVKDVQSTVRRYLRPDAYTLVVARPAASGAVKEAALQRWPHAPDV